MSWYYSLRPITAICLVDKKKGKISPHLAPTEYTDLHIFNINCQHKLEMRGQ